MSADRSSPPPSRPKRGATRAVYVLDADLPDEPITDRPTVVLLEQCSQAVGRLLARHPWVTTRIDVIHFGAMGITDPLLRGLPHFSRIPSLLRARHGLTGLADDAYRVCSSTSETGAVALRNAVQDLRTGRHGLALVVAGEAMFSPDRSRRARDRAVMDAWIQRVIDPDEVRGYGLSMLPVGDLFMDHVAWRTGMGREAWRAVLRCLTLDKYQRSWLYPAGMTPAREAASPDRLLTADRYDDPDVNPAVSPWYRRHDVCASGNGATAVLLANDRAVAERAGSSVRIAGIGEGHTRPTVGHRSGPLGRFSAVRRALRGVAHDARVEPALLGDRDRVTALFHDAFPAVEIAFQAEVAPQRRVPDIVAELLSARTNPFGGLCAGGHPMGNSGLHQIAKAFHALTGRAERVRTTGDPLCPVGANDHLAHYLAPLAAPAWLATSVGSAVVDVMATLLVRDEDGHLPAALADARGRYRAGAVDAWFGRPTDDPMLVDRTAALRPDAAMVAARTVIREGPDGDPGWALLVRTAEGSRMAWYAGDTAPPVGSIVGLLERDGRLVVRVAGDGNGYRPEMDEGERRAVAQIVAEALDGRLRARAAQRAPNS